MIVVQETTKWVGASDKCNHIYVLSDDKRTMHAYIKNGSKEVKKFSKPIGFDPRGRTFRIIKKSK